MVKVKLTTKQTKESEQKAALLQRITDVYSGAQGQVWGGDDFATAQTLENAVHALEGIFGWQNDWEYLWANHVLSNFDNPESATGFLFGNGIRA